ncbi:MAG: hypothetical protein K9J06_12550 [Flavobacteriales bacterium]|nr:hypothetical protein [Flavobacteriales bacterium]
MFHRIRRFENIHIVLWLVKDTCWIQDWRTPGCIMIVPTIGMAVYITWLSRSERKELFHNLAVCAWIVANSVWMLGEFFLDDTTRPLATVFFVLGLASIGYYYISSGRSASRPGGGPMGEAT